ncbi:MAG: FAD-dependent oxidoreductase [Proteobacteria bacterium]|nr:FAD-dependent oxidoreductase [Pseudomonadota bacterium]
MQQHIEALSESKYCPLWHDSELKPEALPALSGDASCELLIVGGGFTGLWAALQAKERQPDADIILIEKTFVADGASGRNGGFLNSSLAHGETNTDHHFPGEADRLYELGEKNIEELLATLERYNIDARYEKVGETLVATNWGSVDKLRADYQEEKAAGKDVVWFDRDAMQAQVNSPTFLAGLWYRDGHNGIVDPARLCWGLKRAILDLGVRIFENTALDEVKPLGKNRMKAFCEGGIIESDKILMATNGFYNKMYKVRRAIVPVWDYQLATEPLTEAQLDSIGWHKTRHALSNDANMFHYYRITQDNRITWGGGGAVRYYFNRGTGPECADIPERFEQLSHEFFQTFPQLKGVKFSHRWSGIIATSTRFCMVPGVTYNGRVAWSVGYTGLGVGATRFGARIGIELLGYQPSDIIKMKFVTKKPMAWVPEPMRWIGVRLTQLALVKADANNGKRGLWLRLLDMMNLGFTC